MKKLLHIFSLLFLLVGCSNVKETFEPDIVFDEKYDSYLEEVTLKDNFNIEYEFYVEEGDTIFDYSDLIFDLNLGNQNLQLSMFLDNSYLIKDNEIIELMENDIDKDQVGAIRLYNSHPDEEVKIKIYLYRYGNTLKGYGTYGPYSKTFWNFFYSMEDELPQDITLKITGRKLSLTKLNYIENQLGYFSMIDNNTIHILMCFGIIILLALIAYGACKVTLPKKRLHFPFNALAMLFMAYGITGLCVNFAPEIGDKIINAFNTIFMILESNISLSTGILGIINLVLPYVAIAASIYLIYELYWECDRLYQFIIMLVCGILWLPVIFTILFIAMFLVGEILGMIATIIAVSIFGIGAKAIVETTDFAPKTSTGTIKDEYGNETHVTMTEYGDYGKKYINVNGQTKELSYTGKDNIYKDNDGIEYKL